MVTDTYWANDFGSHSHLHMVTNRRAACIGFAFTFISNGDLASANKATANNGLCIDDNSIRVIENHITAKRQCDAQYQHMMKQLGGSYKVTGISSLLQSSPWLAYHFINLKFRIAASKK